MNGLLEKMSELTQKDYRRMLIERINKSIHAGNLRKVYTQKHVALPITPPVGSRSLNRAVAIARHPGPYMDFKKGDLDDLLVAAGFRP